jgi:S-formylglutathione hydrolase FrmB
LIAAGEIQPLVIVFPYGDAGFYVNNANGGLRWEDHLVKDVVASVDRTYRTLPRASSRAVAGLSMGGDGALQLAIRHPNIFGVAAAHSPSSRLLFEHAPAEVYGNEDYFKDHNPFWLAQAAPGAAKVQFWIDVGDDDPWRWNARAIRAALLARGIAHEFHMPAGGHEGDYWVAHVGDYLRFYSRALLGP